MEDSNIMKNSQYIPGVSKDTTRQEIGPFVDVQTVVDYDSEDFKYTNFNDPMFFFQDPFLPIFDVVLDKYNSPLLMEDYSNTKNCIIKFLTDYSNIYSIGRRKSIYDEFIKTLYSLFNTDFRTIDRNKSYYINSITGLDKMTARIVDFEKDKITINLNEDVSMIAAYLAHLYNNLSYSYRDQRHLIPANLLRFNMYIRIQDVRNMPYYIKENSGTTTYFDKSYQIYFLRDCMFDFKKSKNFEDSLTIAGFDAGAPTKPASITFDIIYKSIEIESGYPLIKNSLNDKSSSALILDNKKAEVYIESDFRLNTVFIKNEKSPENLEDEISLSTKLNNSGFQISNTMTPQQKTQSAIDNYKFGVVSSDTNSSTRESDLKPNGIPSRTTDWTQDVNFNGKGTEPTWNNNDTSLPKILENKRRRLNPSNIDPTKALDWESSANPTDPGGIPTWTSNSNAINDYKEEVLPSLNLYSYESSVDSQSSYPYPASWNFLSDQIGSKPQTGPGLSAWRDSILGELNFYPFLYSLPLNIINWFFGSYGGIPPMYIDTYSRPIPSIDEVLTGEEGRGPRFQEPPTPPQYGYSPDPDEPGEKYVPDVSGGGPNNTPPREGFIPGSKIQPGGYWEDPNVLNGEIMLYSVPFLQGLEGEIIPGYIINPGGTFYDPTMLNGEFIPYAIPFPISLDGEFIPYSIPEPIHLNGEFLPYTLNPLIPLEGMIDTSFTPRGPLSGNINISFTPRGPLEGVIDMSVNPRISLSGYIDMTIIPREFELGYVYTNSYDPRVVDLGLLYVGVDKENILPITYLYSKVDSYKSLEDYYVYNNATFIGKPLNEIKIDQTLRDIAPFELIYEYDNNVDVEKTINNIKAFNNDVEKNNIIDVINVIENIPEKPIFEKEYVYENTSSFKNIPAVYVFDEEETFTKNLSEEYVYGKIEKERSLEQDKIEISEIKSNLINLGNIIEEQETNNIIINLGRIDNEEVAKKLLDPTKLFEPVKKKIINMDYLYKNEDIEQNNFLIKPEIEEKIEFNLEKENEKIYIDQNYKIKEELSKIYVNDKEIIEEKENLNKEDIINQDIKERKDKLNNERLR